MDHKKILMELSKREDLKNRVCCDCSNLNPQWASLSFVRSISMDTWQDDQVKRMQIGGNGPFRDFMRSYSPAEQGGYTDSLSSYDTYHCWAATQYREKLDAELAGKPWSPSAPPPGHGGTSGSNTPERPSSAQGLRKSRTTARGSALRSDSASPSPGSFNNSPSGTPNLDQKTANENYFASLGQLNASRPENLPPSQGGRYQGFGSTPSPQPGSDHASYGLSSRAAPSLADFQESPMAALSKGWSLFSTAVAGASKAVNDNVVRPGMERVNDPNFQASVRGYFEEAQKRATEVGSTANQWGKKQFGVDVAGRVGSVMQGRGDPRANGYGTVPMEHEETSALYKDDDDDFFQDWNEKRDELQKAQSLSTGLGASSSSSSAPATQKAPAAAKKPSDWDDEWKDF
ncbi:arf gtpase activator [Moniliophthora roreri MCA 2997]|uniref:Arf gtpase activator n=1 Tax=Moniliophthora roreri (strain MCA 2997) TaxID=1381753 RepID=V2XRM4_MONRO|nr:arf gtpase activator [Moniliophthora roreri MCA 2997]